MTNQHLDDNMIQAYTWDAEMLSSEQHAHMNTCERCQAKAGTYRALFTKVSELPAPAFDFDLSALVVQQIEHNMAKESIHPADMAARRGAQLARPVKIAWPLLLLCIGGLTLIVGALYYLQEYFTDVLVGLSSLVIITVVIMVLLIAGFLAYDEFRKYHKQMSSLDF